MSSTPAVPAAGTPAPAKKLNAIQIIELKLADFIKQRELQMANLHAINGAIQGAEVMLNALKAEEAKAEAAVESETKAVVEDVKEAAADVVEFVKKES